MGHHHHQHTPQINPNTLRSIQRAKIVDLLGWGELGLGDGTDILSNIYLNDTPIHENGGDNHHGVSVSVSPGTHDQPGLPGYGAVENVVGVGAKLTHGNPVTRTISNPNVTRVRVTLSVPSLVRYTDKGDAYITWVYVKISVGGRTIEKGVWGKTTSPYYRDVVIDNLPGKPFALTVSRTTADSTDDKLHNDTYWSSYVEISDQNENYEDCAVVGLTIDSEQFGNQIPKRSYQVRNISIKMPTNYNPVNRTYSGVWDGNFKTGYTNNPAWLYYHLLTDERYGLGDRLNAAYIDKWALYEIGKYCDVMVDDGQGGREPRMTCNAYLSETEDAKDVLDKVASCFRGIACWDGNTFLAIQDRPRDPVAMYGNANVVDGKFAYQGMANKSIYTAAEVTYIDPDRGYKPNIAYYQDDQAIKEFGRNLIKTEAFGCTSPGQAHRYGVWLVESSILERRLVTFGVGREGLKHTPFDIIEIADNSLAGAQIFGRVVAVDGRDITLDRDPPGDAQTLKWQTPDGGSTLTIVKIEGKTVRLAREPEDLTPGLPYAITTEDVKPVLYRCVSIAENDDGGYNISAIIHSTQKEAIVDKGAARQDVASHTRYHVPAIFAGTWRKEGDHLVLSWSNLTGYGDLSYRVTIVQGDDLYRVATTTRTELTLVNLPYGEYKAEIRAYNRAGQVSNTETITWSLGLEITGLRARAKVFAVELDWALPELVLTSAKIEIWQADKDGANSTRIASISWPSDNYLVSHLDIDNVSSYRVRMVDSYGHAGAWSNSVRVIVKSGV